MKQFISSSAVLAALILAAGAAHAQDAVNPASQATTDAARDALAKKEGDVDQAKLLKETLTATDKQYSLLKKGKVAATYDLTYSYTGQQQIDTDCSAQTCTLTGISTSRGHTITNTVSVDYGLADNLTGNVALPLISKYSDTEKSVGLSHTFGDLALGARYQPFALSRDLPTITATGTLRLATGRSPFKTIVDEGLATGSGYNSLTVGANASKVIDPIALFGSLNLTYAMPAKHLSQERSGKTLVEVRPGPSLGFGAGFAYALSYNISASASFQEAISGRSRLHFSDGTTANTSSQASASMNFGLGVRVSPLTTVNFTVGLGLTSDTPDFTFGMNMPLHF